MEEEGRTPILVQWGTLSLVEGLIHTALLEDKSHYLRVLASIEYEIEAEALIEELLKIQPIMGLHCWPHGQGKELGEAIRYMVDKDEFYERNSNTGIR